MNNPETILKVEQLFKRYRHADRNALNGVSFEVKAGEFFGLLGPNGCGKTTLISILCGLIKASRGDALIFNQEAHAVLPRIGLVPQEIALYPSLSLEQNLEFFGYLYGLSGKNLKIRIEESLQMAQLKEFRHKAVQTFSGGMKRRANLIAGLIHRPEIVFLDEPTANVDPQSRNMIFENLKYLLAQGMTMIYTTHYLEEAEQLCTRLLIMNDGQVVEQGTSMELLKKYPQCRDLAELFLHLTGKNLRDKY